MTRIHRVLVRTGAVLAAAVSAVLISMPAAQAYGPAHLYQLTFSLNCDNKSSPLCAPTNFGLGGAWGWIEVDPNDADATVTFCGHQPGQTGAGHENLNGLAWTIVTSAQLNPHMFVVGTDPTDHYIVFPNSDLAFIAFPVTANHYSTKFGPGISAQATVVRMH
jgi:hypothetical protein